MQADRHASRWAGISTGEGKPEYKVKFPPGHNFHQGLPYRRTGVYFIVTRGGGGVNHTGAHFIVTRGGGGSIIHGVHFIVERGGES